jgi:hypothetical protein
MKIKICVLLLCLLLHPSLHANTELRVGAAMGSSSNVSEASDLSRSNSYSFSPSGITADMIWRGSFFGLGMRLSGIDTIKDYQEKKAANTTQAVKVVDASSIKMNNVVISPLLTMRFHESEKGGQWKTENGSPINFKYRTFAELALTLGKSQQFEMITVDAQGLDQRYYSNDVTNYSGSIITGFEAFLTFSFEFGYKRIDIKSAKKFGATAADADEAYLINYPYASLLFGFNF